MAGSGHRKKYLQIFGLLIVLTILEVGIVYTSISRTLMIVGLFAMAIAKAALVALHFMHLGHETPILRRTIGYCMGIPAVYAVVLIAEAAWRLLG